VNASATTHNYTRLVAKGYTERPGHGFVQLKSDPCAYVCQAKEGFVIITIWVDDLLLFASTQEAMDKLFDQNGKSPILVSHQRS
jgi:hypothetical protein